MKTSLSALLNVRNGTRAVEFYKTAFGAEVLMQTGDESSIVVRLAIESSEFWLADESPEHRNPAPQTLNGSSVRMILVVNDPDAIFKRALAAGAKEVWPVANQPYGWRIGRVQDPFGHHWEIGKPM